MTTEQKRVVKSTILECRRLLEAEIEQVLIKQGIAPDNQHMDADELQNITVESKNGNQLIQIIRNLKKGGLDTNEAVKRCVREIVYTCILRMSALRTLQVRGLTENGAFCACRYEAPSSFIQPIFENISGVNRTPQNIDELIALLNDVLQPVADKLLYGIEAELWKQDEIIGWIFQYLNEKEKNEVFERLYHKKQKIRDDEIPAATQLFTPDWIVKWIVDNSLGTLLREINKGSRKGKRPEEIKVLDPACGCGNFLIQAYDLLYRHYVNEGYDKVDIPGLILENNIYGIDIDPHVIQITALILFIKAKTSLKESDYCITGGFKMNLLCADALQTQSVDMSEAMSADISKAMSPNISEAMPPNMSEGMPPNMSEGMSEIMPEVISEVMSVDMTDVMSVASPAACETVTADKWKNNFVKKYDVVMTNPPYMGRRGMNPEMLAFLDREYRHFNKDLYGAFIKRCVDLTESNGFTGMITQHTFMFISSFKELRKFLLDNVVLNLYAHLGTKAFDDIDGEKVSSVMFVSKKTVTTDTQSQFIRLVNYKSPSNMSLNLYRKENCFFRNQKDFKAIVGAPFLYWIPNNIHRLFNDEKKLSEYIYTQADGNKTAMNQRYIRYFWEIAQNSNYRMCSQVRRQSEYCGHYDSLVDWSKEARDFYKMNQSSNLLNEALWDREGITWGRISSGGFSARYLDKGFIADVSGPAVYFNEDTHYFLGYLNTTFVRFCMGLINPSLNYAVGDVLRLPAKYCPSTAQQVTVAVQRLIVLKKEQLSFDETSLEFKKPALLNDGRNIHDSFMLYQKASLNRLVEINRLKDEIEGVINKLFDIEDKDFHLMKTFVYDYSNIIREKGSPEAVFEKMWLSGALTTTKQGRKRKTLPLEELCRMLDMPLTEGVHIINQQSLFKKGEKKEEVINLLSWYIGCLFGQWRDENIPVAEDGILALDTTACRDELVALIHRCIGLTFGDENTGSVVNEIEQLLGLRLEEWFRKEFFVHHMKKYQKHPLYWHICSPRKTFNCFIFWHKMDSRSLYRVKQRYVSEMIEFYQADLRSLCDERIRAVNNRDTGNENGFKAHYNEQKENKEDSHRMEIMSEARYNELKENGEDSDHKEIMSKETYNVLKLKLDDLERLDAELERLLPYTPNPAEGILKNMIPLEPVLSMPITKA